MTAILLAFFGVVIAVNLTMATFATRTFGGKVVENSYDASQKYNDWLAAARKQDALGWTITPSLDGQRRVTVALDPEGVTLSGFARHPLGREPDVALTFDGYRSLEALPPGRWSLHLLARRGKDEARLIKALS